MLSFFVIYKHPYQQCYKHSSPTIQVCTKQR